MQQTISRPFLCSCSVRLLLLSRLLLSLLCTQEHLTAWRLCTSCPPLPLVLNSGPWEWGDGLQLGSGLASLRRTAAGRQRRRKTYGSKGCRFTGSGDFHDWGSTCCMHVGNMSHSVTQQWTCWAMSSLWPLLGKTCLDISTICAKSPDRIE